MDIGAIFLDILATVSSAITTLLGMLPNPDPFPEILDGLVLETGNGGVGDVFVAAYYWLDSFFVADAVITCLSLWFLMFPIAWIIMMLWKWIKVR